MKRLLLVILVACFAVLALRYFSVTVGSRQSTSRGGKENPPAATAAPSAGQDPSAVASTGGSRGDVRSPEPTRSWWRGFLSWVGVSTPPAKDTASSSSQGTQALLGNKERPHAGGIGASDQSPPFIAGKVMDEAGQAVAGMEISAQPLLLVQVPEGALGSAPVAQARSDRAGAFRFEQLPEGEYRVRTIATDLYLPAEAIVRTGVDSINLVVSRERQLSIQGLVKDNLGNPLQGVRVVASQTPSQGVSTDQNGGYQIQIPVTRSSRVFLKFQLAGYREEASLLNDSQIYAQSVVQLDATLTPVKSVVLVGGIVVNSSGAPLGGEMVYLQGRRRYQTVTNQAGEFLMTDVESGIYYKLSVPSSPPYRAFTKQVWVGPEALFQDVVVERGLAEAASLSGRMIDAAGNPLPRFSLWIQSSNPAARGSVQVTSDDMGLYLVNEVPLGTLSFTTRSQPRLSVTGINLPQGGAQNVDLVLDWGGYEVSGWVVGGDGRPVPVCRVLLSWSYQNGGLQSLSQRETVADANGIFRFAQVGPGVHSVSVSVPGSGRARLDHNVGGDSGPVVVQLKEDAQTTLGRN